MEINSIQNSKVKQWLKYHKKKYRDNDRKFIIEGEHLIEEAINANLIDSIIIRNGYDDPFNFKQTYYVSDEIINKLSLQISKANYLAITNFKEEEKILLDKVVLLDNVQDPGNVGTIIRSAYSFGFDEVILGNTCCDLYNDKCIASTQGALFHINIKRCELNDEIKSLQSNGFKIYGTDLKESKYLSEINNTNKIGIVLGNEGCGVSDEVLKICDQNIKIEMHNFESLNVGIAAGICMYHFRKGD